MSFVDERGFEGVGGAPFAWAVLGAALSTLLAAFLLILIEGGALEALAAAATIGPFAFALAAALIALAAAPIGLPLTWFLARHRLETPWIYPLAGFSAGGLLVVFTPVLTGDLRSGALLEFLPYAWTGALPGCVCGTIWWLTYRRHEQGSGAKHG